MENSEGDPLRFTVAAFRLEYSIYISRMFTRIFELFPFVHEGIAGSRSPLVIDMNDKLSGLAARQHD
jgi:hypothetical protein